MHVEFWAYGMSDMAETHTATQLWVKMTRSMLVEAWRLHPGGEIKMQAVTEHAQSAHRGKSKIWASGNRGDRTDQSRWPVRCSTGQTSRKSSGPPEKRSDGNGLSRGVQPRELPAVSVSTGARWHLRSQLRQEELGQADYGKSLGFT